MRAIHIKKWLKQNKDKYIDLLQLHDWSVHVYVINKANPESKHAEKVSSAGALTATADCRTWYEYRLAKIRLFSDNILNANDLKRIFIHELAHVATASFKLYCRFFERDILYLPSEKQIALEMEKFVCELLAIQIEKIVAGQEPGIDVISSHSEIVEANIEMACLSSKSHPQRRIVLSTNKKDFSKKNVKEEKQDVKSIILPHRMR